MAKMPVAFNPSAAPDPEPTMSEGLIPNGWYPAEIIDTAVKETKSGTGMYLEIVFKITEGPHARRQVWHRLNLWNQNPRAVEIARTDFKRITNALGITGVVEDTEQIEGRTLDIKIGTEAAKGDYEASNRVRDARRYSGSAMAPSGPSGFGPTFDDDDVPF